MSVWMALLLGVVQGLCEFLPVSSSGHLLLLQKLTGMDTEASAFFNVMLHVATLIAVVVVYRKQVWELICHPFCKKLGFLIVATVPTVIAALVFKKVSPFSVFYEAAENGAFLGASFLLTALILLLCDLAGDRGGKKRGLKKMRLKDALVIGGMQCLGVLPGVSRSGSTISGARFAGLSRSAAADFSFLMSIPAILGGLLLEGKDAIEAGTIGVPLPALVVGMIAAGATGYGAVRLMLKLIKEKKLWGFAIYCAVLGVAVVVMQLLGVL